MNSVNIRGGATIVGIGTAGFGEAPGFNHLDLTALAAKAALDDAGLSMKDVDGLFTANMVNMFPTVPLTEYLGLKPIVSVGTNTGGNVFLDHLYWATLALMTGQCEVALICYGSNQRTGKFPIMPTDAPIHEKVYNPREPISSYAMSAARHMYEFGTTREQLAAAAVAARRWAQLNPAAFVRTPLTVQDVLASRMICDPAQPPGLLPGDGRRRRRGADPGLTGRATSSTSPSTCWAPRATRPTGRSAICRT